MGNGMKVASQNSTLLQLGDAIEEVLRRRVPDPGEHRIPLLTNNASTRYLTPELE